MRTYIHSLLVGALFLAPLLSTAQKNTGTALVYVDKQGVLRYTKGNKEAAFFGVNYTAPFAYSYRAHKRLGVNIEEAIKQDVYQMARLGLDAFRVHIWDTEISDTVGNLLENEHLRLFDFLLAELKKRNIKVIITAIAFGNNGYPEKDEATPGFSKKFGKENATVNEAAIRAQENYLKQLLKHVNPYLKSTYVAEPNIVAVELNNEPSHSGPKEGVTKYINRLAAVVRAVGWKKPVFYNIAQNPYYADAVAKANIDGVSFQWYPTGLVSNQEVKGNFLPNVDHYAIPFDTIHAFRNKARMVYEFDAADMLQSNMYPAMARSFREAGFQWATQFAYDPSALAYANTEYQTHYLNLLYTPAKAVSILIASRAFHRLPRHTGYGSYPVDTSFDAFHVSYADQLSEMNTINEFYYSGSTNTMPPDVNKLQHIAGVGSSPVVRYSGNGAYFLDKISNGTWRLEVYPDAIHCRDPFERASPQKEVTRLVWNAHQMQLSLPGMEWLHVRALNAGNKFSYAAPGNSFQIAPGTYLISTSTATIPLSPLPIIGLEEFGAILQSPSSDIIVRHEPMREVRAGNTLTIAARIVGLDPGTATLQVTKFGDWAHSFSSPMVNNGLENFRADIPAEMVTPGELDYRIILRNDTDYSVFPGNHKKDPDTWDNTNNDVWQTFVVGPDSRLELFNPNTDRYPWLYPDNYKKDFQTSFSTGTTPHQLTLKLSTTGFQGYKSIGFCYYVGNKVQERGSEVHDLTELVIRARTNGQKGTEAKVLLINKDAFAFSTTVLLDNVFTDQHIPLAEMVPDSLALLPNAYPGFLPIWFKATGSSGLRIGDIEKIEVFINQPADHQTNQSGSIEIESIWLDKK